MQNNEIISIDQKYLLKLLNVQGYIFLQYCNIENDATNDIEF